MTKGYAMAARKDHETVGYMLFNVFPFHDELTAFCPIIAHAAQKNQRRQIFERLYQNLSSELVAKGIPNHTITYFVNDAGLQETVFGLGFGLIVVDAFRGLDSIAYDASNVNIVEADPSRVEVVMGLGEEARGYYLEAPLFLSQKERSREYYEGLFEKDTALFLAFRDTVPVGIMQIRKNKELDAITLCDINTGLIDHLGAYVKPEYRSQGIGKALLSKCIRWCQNRDITRIHVDFESANLSGRSFWPKYFTATMHSVRRNIYSDAVRTLKD